jgi:hypothetical protein
MGNLFIWLITGIQAIVLPIIEYFGKRAVIYATVVTAFVALTALLATRMQSFIATALSGTVSDTYGITTYIGLILPSNFSLCVSVIINTILAKMSYDYMTKLYGLAKS